MGRSPVFGPHVLAQRVGWLAVWWGLGEGGLAAVLPKRRSVALQSGAPPATPGVMLLAVALLLGGVIEGCRSNFRQAIQLLIQQGRNQEAQRLHKQAGELVKLEG